MVGDDPAPGNRYASLTLPRGDRFQGASVSEMQRHVADPDVDQPLAWSTRIMAQGLLMSAGWTFGTDIRVSLKGDGVPAEWREAIRLVEERIIEDFGAAPAPDGQPKAKVTTATDLAARQRKAEKRAERRETLFKGLRHPITLTVVGGIVTFVVGLLTRWFGLAP